MQLGKACSFRDFRKFAGSVFGERKDVRALAENGGMRRDGIYRTIDGTADPKLSSILKLFAAMNVQLVVKPLPNKPLPVRTKLGRPRPSQ